MAIRRYKYADGHKVVSATGHVPKRRYADGGEVEEKYTRRIGTPGVFGAVGDAANAIGHYAKNKMADLKNPYNAEYMTRDEKKAGTR